MSYSGGCSCGSVRFTTNYFLYLLAFHCNECKKRTGSAFGLSVVVEKENIENFQSETKTFTRMAESGRIVSYEFCPDCGSTLPWGLETVPSRSIFAGGNFDDRSPKYNNRARSKLVQLEIAHAWAENLLAFEC